MENEATCIDCASALPLKVLHSNAGYYIGTFCSCCGPYSRESEYFKTRDEAEKELKFILKSEKE
ncbi:MAG: hypothetical protein ACTSO3_01025 [Candidatus Heimdallarchaeaceae archaeon]